jgi:hypothetical protein
MKDTYHYLVYSLAVIFLLTVAGCFAPPQGTSGNLNNSDISVTKNTTTPSYVSEVPLADYASSTHTPVGYTTFLPTTRIPADITCRIYTKNAAYGYNGSAFTFNLKNPPMYINYTVIPTNVTVNRSYTSRYLNKKTESLTYSDYSPQSWFEVTVRSNASKEIYLQDGFGKIKGYPEYLNRTLKVIKLDDMLVEFQGNNIKASASIWVKPTGNFEESKLAEFTDCMYWDDHRDTLTTPKPTTIAGVIYTWTPENQVRK